MKKVEQSEITKSLSEEEDDFISLCDDDGHFPDSAWGYTFCTICGQFIGDKDETNKCT